ncbi:hypothetical protein BD324DRAFT_615104 [Kockovaella imperatae]|uniref:Uncharacterized protein n=1 Tax=Kockovaella imperatae TaxID=4999 RepID=A0A1Y1UP87_9TREE|nr:hypothetical protein BD324DRAFT_615104 [Kockovaella imperatae]ORX39819.1 hypothetical protein BD324DRAFT_615104 [Kockovaella imperatae]
MTVSPRLMENGRLCVGAELHPASGSPLRLPFRLAGSALRSTACDHTLRPSPSSSGRAIIIKFHFTLARTAGRSYPRCQIFPSGGASLVWCKEWGVHMRMPKRTSSVSALTGFCTKRRPGCKNGSILNLHLDRCPRDNKDEKRRKKWVHDADMRF